jgi:WXG100 family type VII secretion target
MDPVVLRGVAQRLRREADQLDHVVSTVQRAVDDAVHLWDGEDAHSFNSWWASHYRPAMTTAHQTLVDMASTIERNVTEQEKVSGGGHSGASAHGGGGGGGDGWGGPPGPRDLLTPLWPAELVGTGGDFFETWKGWKLDELPGGGYLGAGLKGIGLGSAGVELIDSVQHGDPSGAGAAAIDGVSALVPAPVSLLWTGLSEEVFFFVPKDYTEQDALLSWLQQERGLTPEQISERYTGFQGFINMGNDNAALKAPWLVDGADKLMEKPAEWLYYVGIRF